MARNIDRIHSKWYIKSDIEILQMQLITIFSLCVSSHITAVSNMDTGIGQHAAPVDLERYPLFEEREETSGPRDTPPVSYYSCW